MIVLKYPLPFKNKPQAVCICLGDYLTFVVNLFLKPSAITFKLIKGQNTVIPHYMYIHGTTSLSTTAVMGLEAGRDLFPASSGILKEHLMTSKGTLLYSLSPEDIHFRLSLKFVNDQQTPSCYLGYKKKIH